MFRLAGRRWYTQGVQEQAGESTHEPQSAVSPSGEDSAPTPVHAPGAGGAGLYDSPTRNWLPGWANVVLGLSTIGFVALVAGSLIALNPAFGAGVAAGTRDQIGVLPSPKGEAAEIVVEPGTPAAEGRVLIAQKGCGGCHVVPGVRNATGTIGPSLAGVGARTTIAGGAVQVTGPDDLTNWLLDPQALKPGTLMPNVGLTPEEAANITAYLELLE